MNKRGIALILGFTIIVVLTILGAAIVSRSVSERAITQKSNASTKAFWAAEAGIAKAAAELPNAIAVSDDDVEQNSTNNLQYDVPQPNLVTGYTNRWMIISTGRYILNQTTQDKIERTIRAIVEKTGGANSILIENAIETTGELSIKGSVDINPDGSYKEESSLSFEDVFGMSKDEVKALADRVYTDPPSNQQPVDGITWVDLTGTNKYSISSNWSGSGLLIVNGNGTDVALEISGSWTFEGVIWVIGKLKISGTPTISGAVFAESGADVENTLRGNATLNFDAEAKDNAFNLITGETAVNILSWQEQVN